MRDAVGADAARALRLLDRHRFTFLVEDPATLWDRGPGRYREIGRRYRDLGAPREMLGIDINVVDRYQDVYPTQRQMGTELFQLVHAAAVEFKRVALYLESSILPEDWPFVAAAAAGRVSVETAGGGMAVRSAYGVVVPWNGAAIVDGRSWPVMGGGSVGLPAGSHLVEPEADDGRPRVVRFNGELISAQYGDAGQIEIAYRSSSRAAAVLDRRPARVRLDGAVWEAAMAGSAAVLLPRGQHLVAFEFR
jgi:hypothetical protein